MCKPMDRIIVVHAILILLPTIWYNERSWSQEIKMAVFDWLIFILHTFVYDIELFVSQHKMKQLKYISLTTVTGKINYFQSSAKHVDSKVLVVTSILIDHYRVESDQP